MYDYSITFSQMLFLIKKNMSPPAPPPPTFFILWKRKPNCKAMCIL